MNPVHLSAIFGGWAGGSVAASIIYNESFFEAAIDMKGGAGALLTTIIDEVLIYEGFYGEGTVYSYILQNVLPILFGATVIHASIIGLSAVAGSLLGLYVYREFSK